MKEETTRQLKVARLIQKDIADILQKEYRNEIPGKLLTVTLVKVSPDLAIAKCYLSIFPGEGDTVIDYLNNNRSQVRFKLGNKVRNQLRIVPELIFYLDDTLDYNDKIDKLLKE
jgi:ribosome-binding factor A